VVDSTYILGRGAVRDTYNLIGDGIVGVGRILSKLSGKRLEEWSGEHELKRYVGSSLKGEVSLDWSDEGEKRALLSGLAGDAERVLEMAAMASKSLAETDVRRERLRSASEILRQVLVQDVEPDPDAPGGGGGKKLRQGTSGERICSVQDPEMRHGRKSASVRFDGHKAQVVTDVESGLITAVSVMAGSAKDEEGSLEVVQEAGANTGLEVEATLGDCAYGSGKNRERFQQAGIELLAKVPKPACSKYFGKHEFEIDLEAMSCRCPAGQTTSKLNKAGTTPTASGERVQMYAFSFPGQTCAVCPLRTQCYGESKKQGRSVVLNPHEALLQRARSWQRSPEFDEFRKQRQVVEHRIGRLLQLGIRQARYFGRHKTLFQVQLAAALANLTLTAGKSGGMAPRSTYRTLRAVLLALLGPAHWLMGLRYTGIAAQAAPRPVSFSRPSMLPVNFKTAPSRPGL
jgi:hypothetical protein